MSSSRSENKRSARPEVLGALFVELLKISTFVIGGGYAIIAVADRVFARRGWIEEGELLDRLPIFQTIPGLIATHTAVYVGRKMAGPIGSFAGVFAVALPSIVCFTFVSIFYKDIPLDNFYLGAMFVGLRATLTGIILATVVRSWLKMKKDVFSLSLLAAALCTLTFLRVPVALVLVGAMLCGIVSAFGPKAGEFRLRASWLPLLLFAQYGALCLGGGFVIVPMYLRDFVGPAAPYLQFPATDFSNVMALSQMTPGPIGVNCATFFGFQLAGIPGALIASAMLLLPGSLLAYCAISTLEHYRESRVVKGFMRGVRPASLALMMVALFAFTKLAVFTEDGQFSYVGAVLTVATAFLSRVKRISVVLLIILTALTSLGVMCLGRLF